MELDGKIQSLNTAIEETVPLLVEDARDNPDAELTIQSLLFATKPTWLDPVPVPVEDYRWTPVAAVHQGLTELGLAILELVPAMREMEAIGRGFAPAIVLVSDGKPSHVAGPRMEDALEHLLAEPWGRASIRAAIGIGRDADMGTLHAFMGKGDLQPVRADGPEELVSMIQWMSRMVPNLASSPAGQDAKMPSPLPPQSGRAWDVPTS
ncbi:MAG: vWA domain-containing protein [Nocardioidaceae bacterium]